MFSVTFDICKQLVRSKSFRLIYSSASVKKNEPHSEIEMPPDKLDLSEITRNNQVDICRTIKYVKKVNQNGHIDWESLTEKLTEENIRNPPTKILQACFRLGNVSLAEKYHGYLTEKGYQWTVFDKIYFCKTLLKQKSSIPNYEYMFVSLYEQVKPLLNSSKLIQGYLNELFVEIPHTYNKLINDKSAFNSSSVAGKAVELHDMDKAFEIINHNVEHLDPIFLEKCAKACIENAKDGKFTIDFMNKLVDVCTKYTIAINNDECLIVLKSMFKNLNLHDSNYHWTVQDCTVGCNSICSSCQLPLKPNTLSLDEFEEMRADFLNIILKESYLYSTDNELQRFLNFLKNSQPYDVVIDALNLIYLRKVTGIQMVHHYMQHFLDEGHNLLVVSRKHVKGMLLKPSFVKYQKYKTRLQYFFIENLSNDDIFILYSALHSGPNTQVVTGDLLRNHSSKLSKINRCRFFKWQMSNQYSTDLYLNLAKPVSHCGLSQLTHTPTQQNGKYIWHLSHQASNERLLRKIPVEWICVTATKRKLNLV